MKSKTLSFNMMKESAKRQMWVFAVMCVVLFVCIPLSGIISIEEWRGSGFVKLEEMHQLFADQFFGQYSGGGLRLFLASILLGAFCGICGFSYLHTRNKVDFYHSIPMRREQMYLNQLAVSFGMYAIVAAANVLLLMCAGLVQGLFTLEALAQAGAAVVVGLVFFLMGFAISSIAMLLTGKTLVGVLGTAVLLTYSNGVHILLNFYKREFYYTYYDGSMSGDMLLHHYFSPVSWSENIAQKMTLQQQIFYTILAAGAVAVLVGLAIFLYRKRSLEQAENSMAFPKVAEVIKVFMVIPLALATGMFFWNMVTYRKLEWLIFGTFFGWILFYGVIQMIYYMDLRKIIANKLQFLISGVAVGMIVCIFQFDFTGYDNYMPSQEDVREISYITTDFLGESIDLENMEKMGLGNGDDVYQLAQMAAASSIANSTRAKHESDLFLVTRYELNNGKVVWRQYLPDSRDIRESLVQLYNNEKYLDYQYPIRIQNPEQVQDIFFYANGNEQIIFPAEDKEKIAFIQTVQEDMKNLNGSVFSQEIPVARISYNYNTPIEKDYIYNPEGVLTEGFNFNIYPSFTKTLKMLEEKGYPIISMKESDVESITIWRNDREVADLVYTSQEDIQAIIPSLIRENLVTPWQNIIKTMDCKVTYITSDGNQREEYYKVMEDKAPDILKQE